MSELLDTPLVHLPQGPIAIKIYEPANYRGDAILIHGYTGSKEDFDYIGPLLAQRGYRVFTPDNRGQHESPHAEDVALYSVGALGRDVVDIARHYKLDRPHLFGHSLGGVIAQRAFVAAPELFRSLTLFCTGPSAQPVPKFAKEIQEKMADKSMQEAWDEFAADMYATHPRHELMQKRWLANDPRSLLLLGQTLMTFESVIPAIAATDVPIHVIYGEDDDAWPVSIQDQMAADLSAPVTVIANAGHCPNEDQPEKTAEVVADFWGLSHLGKGNLPAQ
jgi:pimeloyl-ACP methyl ester carboxylesterase